jgi:hypothetical protein
VIAVWVSLSAVAAVALACAVLLVVRVRVRARGKATASIEGDWSAAAGGAVGPVAFTAGFSPRGAQWMAHLLGRRVARGAGVPRRVRARVGERVRRPSRAGWGVARALLRRVRFDRLDAVVRGTAGDPATNAHVMGLVSAASATLAPWANVTTDVDWMADSAFVDVDFDLEASFVPLLLGWDLARATWMQRSARS